ncbi:PLP-dependent aminotransferase family protein [Corynebacterium accolens]|uniref:MocR-like pyridoxine biosynthesis transcription factor PdxR n=1 Tax=Corynebacterium accolens TaxID=38284 RepID=UPI00223ADE9E|nr:PLP-dependent aminotransferase family protein [Corynebacterium accolens]MCT1409650.1 PLP-dependent aminotransferase family protein [Corynebacterium accolens]MDK4259093.1 PLP-dependent aminotransferase family protein [Corynebacterium accolens]MDK4261633.1 PLP-dependent aminotransferase family protein [Corynebacterium accolens]MDK4270715.1 PLP-dependent aminotransferase family protein [Corynebacterium accolens]MDK8710212.1 PLP-dependent aminotransferase family protein [Corynebacterium accolen
MPLRLDPADTRALPVQIADAVRADATSGALLPGEAVPSTRALATQLGVSRGSVVTAYEQLTAEGYLSAEVGSGTVINPRLPHSPPPRPEPAPQPTPAPNLLELTPGLPDTAGIITPEWRAAWRDAAAQPLSDAPPLPHHIANHLRYMRGLRVDPRRIVVTAGARDGLALVLRTLGTALRVGVESPGYPSLRRVPQALGHELVNVPTDADGVTVPDTDLDALIVTPSHQYPYGASLPAERRAELVAWARQNGALLIEDDFDSELRYVGQPLPALAALAPERTVLLGTFSTVISPSIACGYVVVPDGLRGGIDKQRDIFGQPVGTIPQAALAHYLASGALRRHTGRMRRTYKRRRDLVADALGTLPGARLLPINGGLHAVLLCDPAIVLRAAARGIKLTPLREYWGGVDAEDGVVLGFGHLSDDDLRHSLSAVAAAQREC